MTRTLVRSLLVCCGFFVACSSVAAQEADQVGSIEVVKAEAGLYEKLVQDPQGTAPRGFVQTVTPPAGQVFLVVWMEVKATPGKSETGDDLTQIRQKAISLRSKGGSAVAVGRCSRDGRFNPFWGDFYYYGSAENIQPWDLVFAVPAKERAFELRLGKTSHKLKVIAAPAPTVPRAAIADFEIQKIAAVDKLQSKSQLGSYDQTQVDAVNEVESPATKYVTVDIAIKPKAGNGEGGFMISSGDIGLLFGSQVYVPPVGTVQFGEFSPYVGTLTSQRDAQGEYPAVMASVVFPVPGKLTKFKVLYLMEAIGEGVVPK